MFRVRFHGRGGQGVKTASRILGTAAFLAGWEAQDSPVYGAERRGAPVTAYTRVDRNAIRERGIIANPDLIVVADESLFADPTAAILAGQKQAAALFANSPMEPRGFAAKYGITCPVITKDLTHIAAETLGKASALSAAVGAAVCRLGGIIDLETVLQAVSEELAELHLNQAAVDRNLQLARRVFEDLDVMTLRIRLEEPPCATIQAPTYAGVPAGAPMIRNVANSAERHTGAWRILRPVIDRDICTRCQLCVSRCPDAAMSFDAEDYPLIDEANCKGCMICAEVCPLKCIREEKEVQAW